MDRPDPAFTMEAGVETKITQAVQSLLPLPVLSGTVARVRALADDEDASHAHLVEAIEGDESFALNLLRYANSSSLRPLRARSIRHAATLVGRRAIGRLALEAATYRFFAQVPGVDRGSRGQLHTHAVKVARVASAAAARSDVDGETAHLAGLLHDVGKLVLPLAFGAGALQAISAQAETAVRHPALERERLGVDHAHAGALLAEQAGAGASVATAIGFHHGGSSGCDTPDPVAACVQLANGIVALAEGEEADQYLIDSALRCLDLPLSALDDLAEHTVAFGTSSAALAERVLELERLAGTDDLTGVSNRRHWSATVQGALERDEAGAVLLADVDRFKQINDLHGHRTGDLVLVAIAGVLRRYGHTGRLGGDEFVVWVPGGHEDGHNVASAIVGEVAQGLEAGLDSALSLSIGIATAPQRGRDLTSLLEHADAALYRAKATGRGLTILAE